MVALKTLLKHAVGELSQWPLIFGESGVALKTELLEPRIWALLSIVYQ